MNDYAKKKCELLEKKGFESNGFAWWIEDENETSRTYGFVIKHEGASVCTVTLSLVDDVLRMNELYTKIKGQMKEIKVYNTEGGKKDAITSDYADYDWMFSELGDWANEIHDLNWRVHLVSEGRMGRGR